MWTIALLFAATFVSEDAALLGAAGAARAGSLSPVIAGASVAVGIWVGDVALYLAGRLAWRWRPLATRVERRWPQSELQVLAARLERRAGWALLGSRLLPGSRVPLYVAAGVFRLRARVFLGCTAAAVGFWSAAIVWGAQWLP